METKQNSLLAQNTYTSSATIVRLCEKLGLKGYNDFKIKYSAELKINSDIYKQVDVNYPFIKSNVRYSSTRFLTAGLSIILP
ncbi:hypothetical protein [uncultured Clostridium sp.]|uniref:hypothetical protein n=1 Tax=uncultured Clostridium sp. TaxID=59620 RepID=UPI00345AEFCE